MTKQTRKFIATLRQQFKAADDTTRQQIWNILTALRGPDTKDSYDLKDATTAVIRYFVFGDSLMADIPASVKEDDIDRKTYRAAGHPDSYHFLHHARDAFDVLGLKWDEVNVPKTKKKVKK